MFRANATITFKIAQTGGTVTRNPVTGAPIQVMQSITVEASLEEIRKPNEATLPGVDESALYLEGRLTSPKFLTDAMRVGKVVEMTLSRGRDTELKGKFYLLPTSSSRLGLEGVFGDPIKGFFEVGG